MSADSKFAIQIDMVGGGTLHMFSSGAGMLREAIALRDGWRSEHPDKYWAVVDAGQRRRIFMRDIADVRVIEGGR